MLQDPVFHKVQPWSILLSEYFQWQLHQCWKSAHCSAGINREHRSRQLTKTESQKNIYFKHSKYWRTSISNQRNSSEPLPTKLDFTSQWLSKWDYEKIFKTNFRKWCLITKGSLKGLISLPQSFPSKKLFLFKD